MPASIRISEELDKLIDRTAKVTGKSRSEIVRTAAQEYCAKLIDDHEYLRQQILERAKRRSN